MRIWFLSSVGYLNKTSRVSDGQIGVRDEDSIDKKKDYDVLSWLENNGREENYKRNI